QASLRCRSGRQFQSGLAGEPFVGVPLQTNQLVGVELRQLAGFRPLRLAIGEFVNAARSAVDTSRFVTLACVAPIEHEYAAIGAIGKVHPSEPRIARQKQVAPVPADVTGSVP